MLERSATFARKERDSHNRTSTECNRFLEYMPTAIAMFDRQMQYTIASRRWREEFGVVAKEGTSLYEDCPGHRDRWQEAQQNCFQGAVSVWEEAITDADGMLQWVKWEFQPWYDEMGEVGGTIVSAEKITDLKNIEEQLQRSLKELEDIKLAIDIASIVAITDTQGTITHINDRFCKLSQYSREELLGQNHRILNSNYHPPQFFQQLWSTISSGQVWQGEIKNRAKDGTFYWVDTTIVPCVDALGTPYQYIAICNDISDRKRIEDQLQESKKFLQLVFDNIPQLIFWKDRNSVFLGCNQNAAKISGLNSPAEIVGKTDYDLSTTPEEVEWYLDFDRRVMESGEPRLHIIETQQQADGKIAWLDTNKIPLRNADGEVVGILVTIEDITERKHAEEILQRSNEELEEIVQQRTVALRKAVAELKREIRYRRQTQQQLHQQAQFLQSIWDGVDYGMFILDVLDDGEEYRFSRFNPTLARTSQVPIDRLLGKTLKESFPPDVADLYRQRYQECARSGRSLNFEEWMEVDNVEKWWLLNLAPLRNETGKIYQIVVTLTDITHRKQMETALVQSEARFRQFVENANDLIYSVDYHGNFTYLSPQFPQMFGYDLAEFQDRSFAPLVHPEDLSKVTISNQQLFETGERQLGLEFRARHRDGSWIWIVCNNTPIENTEGQIIGFQGIARDISDRKAAETELMLFKHAVECSSNAIGMADPQGNHIYQNPAFSQLYECETVESFNEFGGISAVFTDRSVAQDIIKALLAGDSWTGEVEQRSRTGRLLPVLMRADTIKDESGTVVGLIGTTTDISNLKKAQNALAESEAKFRHLVEGANDVIYSISLDAVFTYVSPQATEMLGYHPSELIGQSVAQRTHPDDIEIVAAFNQSIIETGKPRAGIEIRVQCKDGSWCWITCNNSPIKDVNGNIVGIQGMARDITDRKAAELQLKQQATELENAFQELKRTQAQMLQSEKMSSLGQMVAGVAHEINNPVNFIHGNLTHAQDYVLDLLNLIELYGEYYPTPVVEIQEEIEKIELDFIIQDLTKIFQSMRVGTDRIREIVLSLRNFSRLDESDLKAADLHEGIENTLMLLQNRLKAKSDRPAIDVIKNYGDLPMVECYPGQLNQVFMNIFSNAIDALEDREKNRIGEELNPKTSQISIETELVNAKTAQIRIKDNGIGIPKSIQKQIFDPFFTTKDVGKGTGLGMSISYQIITDRHNGSISCISLPGTGAEFIIEIPLQQDQSFR